MFIAGLPMKPGDEQVRGPVVEALRSVDLLEPPFDHRDAVAHRHRLDLVVGDVDRRWCRAALQPAISARICTRSLASRFDSGSSIRKASGSRTIARPIATRWRWPPESWPRLAVQQSSSPRMSAAASHALVDLGLRQSAAAGRTPCFRTRHVRVERVVLEHHRDVAVLGRHVVDDPVVRSRLAHGDLLEPGDHPQRGRLAAARRADEHDELAVGDVEIRSFDRRGPVGVDLADLLGETAAIFSSDLRLMSAGGPSSYFPSP